MIELFLLLGATRVWYLFVLATDNGKPHRQSKHNIEKKILVFVLFFVFQHFAVYVLVYLI